ncbi:PLAT domain-containing protein 3-like [Carica papaya]|uniref:PLAT domain-containing protein 3-like n=1 Tax=Carica papaya TaxID=3649 RepID=UPI000B8CEB12|nr:PLAT domain-containing protein 3-like [Carica papaya]
MTIIRHLPLLLLLGLFFSATACGESSIEIDGGPPNRRLCVYTLYIKTGGQCVAPTTSTISVTLENARGASVHVADIKSWGLMGPKHTYFRRNSVDIFVGVHPCIAPPICRIKVTSTGSGCSPDWYLSYVDVTSTGLNEKCYKTHFRVNQWLSRIFPPCKLSAVVDRCPCLDGTARSDGTFEVENSEQLVA